MQTKNWWLPKGRQGEWIKWMKGTKRYNFPVIKEIIHRDVVYSIERI